MLRRLVAACWIVSLCVAVAFAAKSGVGDLDRGDTRFLISECKLHALLRTQCAYVLATAFHETGGLMMPVRETFATSDNQANARLDSAWAKGKLPGVSSPYWREGWFGRGYSQLTHEKNYRIASINLGIDFVADPAKALVPEIAAKVLVMGLKEGLFTGKKLSDYIDLGTTNFIGARHVINGTDHAGKIATYAVAYDAALEQDGYGVTEATANRRSIAGTHYGKANRWTCSSVIGARAMTSLI
ncbi:hypothetical protein LZK82_27525 (plasmid) [Rhizobium leguminosarum]|uniref:hypothetical protein n=1 Tax=Rhizobium leguminosarum TaxID=384 RepID=UPI00067F0BB8|nr:hypothetical protein [Rhizobium leguminosarum]UIK01221.1 hypothetical protein LZK82_27525 [Rhizobium leguminosarum]UIK14139.1 hypothetical protein LZK80_33155 [Rhizobium leguminosarum]UIL30268.1 hypothetical protein LZK75_27865 [Rhizobium leguminosarum]WFT90912.1 hypothetical protein QA638_36245 [Rhizobium leguminosarum]